MSFPRGDRFGLCTLAEHIGAGTLAEGTARKEENVWKYSI